MRTVTAKDLRKSNQCGILDWILEQEKDNGGVGGGNQRFTWCLQIPQNYFVDIKFLIVITALCLS